MKPKNFYGILSAIIAIPLVFMLLFIPGVYSRVFPLMGFLVFIGIFIGIPATILIIIHKWQIKKQKQRKDEKTDSEESPRVESQDDNDLLGTIQERLAKGEISVKEFQEIKKEFT